MTAMPYKNSAMPPSSDMTSAIPMPKLPHITIVNSYIQHQYT